MSLRSWLSFVCVFPSGEWTAGSCGDKSKGLKTEIFLTHKPAFGYLDFKERSARKTQAWKDATKFGMC